MAAVLTDRIVWFALVCAVVIRLTVAVTSPYLFDESDRSISLANTISFAPESLHLPIRGPEHPALPSYVVKLSETMFGASPLGRRALHVVAGLLMIVVLTGIAFEWQGLTVARWTALLLTFNEYHIGVSAYATAKAPHLLFVALSLWAFVTALRTGRLLHLWLAAACVGVAFYSKEYSALRLPIYAAVLLLPGVRGRFRLQHLLIAAAVFFAVISPDLLWHVFESPDDHRWRYGDHLARMGVLAVNPGYLMFYVRDALQAGHFALTGQVLLDSGWENPSMNSLLGALLLAGVVWATLYGRRGIVSQLLIISFWSQLLFFVFFAPDAPHLPPFVWYWVDMTVFPATLLTAHWLASLAGTRRTVVWLLTLVALGYGAWHATAGGFIYEPHPATVGVER